MINKTAKWAIWSALLIGIAIFVFQQTGWFSSATAKENIKIAAAKMLPDSLAGDTAESTLNNAREAAAHRNVDRAILIYKEYIAQSPRDFDARGELGNVYYMNGRLLEAAQTYYATANLLIDENQFDGVYDLLHAIDQARPMMADELTEKLHKKMSTQSRVSSGGGAVLPQPLQSALTRY